MDLSGFAAAAGGSGQQSTAEVLTAVVVRADESGLWVAPVDDDPRHPVGPCRGGYTGNGTRVPPGAVVALVMTPEGPWAIGVDNPALAINDSTLAPFQNASFEEVGTGAYPLTSDSPAPGWSDFWSSGRRDPSRTAPDSYMIEHEEGAAAHGARCLRVDARGDFAWVGSTQWTIPAGASLEVTFYARATGPNPICNVNLFSAPPTGNPDFFGTDVSVQGVNVTPVNDDQWLRYRVTFTAPPTHTKARLYFAVGTVTDGTLATVRLDNVDADLIDLDPAAVHQDFIRRATATLAGGGARVVTAGGNIAWSQPFTIAGAGLDTKEAVEGRFDIAMPGNGVVIPVHHSLARTSVTVTGNAILLNPNEALWYELPIGQVAASQPGRFHVLASELAEGYDVPPHWILVVRRTAWSSTAHAPEYLWGDGQQQDPWRTPDLNSGWAAGTAAPRFAKGPGQVVRLIGRVKDGAGSAFTLPPGYHPTVTPHEDVVRDGAGNPALITVTTGGVVTTAGSNTDHSIATTFVAGQ